jgi:hypothetical protein
MGDGGLCERRRVLREERRALRRRPRWIRPLADYERRETTIVEGLRYG